MPITTDEARGEAARAILENPLYKEAYQTIEANIVNQLSQAEITQERAEYLRKILVASRKLRIFMEQILMTGTMSAMEEQKKSFSQSIKERAQRFSIMG